MSRDRVWCDNVQQAWIVNKYTHTHTHAQTTFIRLRLNLNYFIYLTQEKSTISFERIVIK